MLKGCVWRSRSVLWAAFRWSQPCSSSFTWPLILILIGKRWWIWTVQISTIKSISCNVFLSPTRYVHIRVCMYFCMAVKASLGGRWYSLKMTGPCHRPSTMHQGGSQGIALHQRRRDALALPTALAKATLGIATFFHTRDSSQPPIIHPTPLCARVTDTDN